MLFTITCNFYSEKIITSQARFCWTLSHMLCTVTVPTGLVAMALLVSVIHGHALLMGQKIGMIVRISTSAAIHNKVSISCISLRDRVGVTCTNKVHTDYDDMVYYAIYLYSYV